MIRAVIIYDISDDKRRLLVSNLLEGYGKRVNRSVFECQVKHVKQRKKLEDALTREINPKVDSLRVYTVCANCMESSTVLGTEPDPFDKDAVYFF